MTVEGTCPDRYEPLRAAFEAAFANGLESGASLAVAEEGEVVVDLWGGVADAETGRPWERDTVCCLWSTTKTMTALCVLALADRGEIDLDAPVARYWPEFAAAGKEDVLVRHVMAHTAGVAGWDRPMTEDDLVDRRAASAALAEQAPWWDDRSVSGYHAITQGFLLGEVVERVTGASLGSWFREEVAGPLGADFHIGTPEEVDPRIATIEPPSGPLGGAELTDDGSIPARALRNPVVEATVSRQPEFRRAEMPASNGHGNARSVATVQALVSNGGEAGGFRLLREAGLERIFDVQSVGDDLILGVPNRLGIGFGLSGPEAPVSPNPRACYWGGWGGSIVVNDLDARTTFAYGMNRMGDGLDTDHRSLLLLLAFYQSRSGDPG